MLQPLLGPVAAAAPAAAALRGLLCPPSGTGRRQPCPLPLWTSRPCLQAHWAPECERASDHEGAPAWGGANMCVRTGGRPGLLHPPSPSASFRNPGALHLPLPLQKPLRSAALLGLLLLGCLALGAVAQDGAAAAAATATGGEAKPAADAAPAVVPAATATASPAEAAVAAAEVPSPSPTPAAEAAPAVTPEKKDDGDAAALAKAAESAAKAATAAAEAATAAVAAAGAAKAADDKKTEELKKPDAAPTAAANTTVKAEAADPVDKPAEPAKPADEKKETAVAATITAPVATPKVAAGKPATPTQEDDEEAEEEDDDDDDDKEDKKAKKRANKKQRAKKEAFTNKVVDFAPSVNVTFGDDIDDEGESSAALATRQAPMRCGAIGCGHGGEPLRSDRVRAWWRATRIDQPPTVVWGGGVQVDTGCRCPPVCACFAACRQVQQGDRQVLR